MGRRAEDGITRRDFLEGSLIAAGGLAVLGSFPARALAHYPPGTTFPPDGPIGLDPRVHSNSTPAVDDLVKAKGASRVSKVRGRPIRRRSVSTRIPTEASFAAVPRLTAPV